MITKELQIKNYSLSKIEDIKQMAIVLQDYIKKNNLSVKIMNKDYVMVEGYAFAGMLLGLSPRIVKVENISPDKWLAQAEIINKKGEIVSIGYALCSKAESKKAGFDEYAICSQAQTRAIGKAYRNLLGWIMKMTGMEATPAEEMKTTPVEKTKEKATYEVVANYIKMAKTKEALKAISERLKVNKNFTEEQLSNLELLIYDAKKNVK